MDEQQILSAPTDAMRSRTRSGVLATIVSQIIKLVFQFISVVILARLIHPQEFGIFAMALPIVGFAMLIQEFGLSNAVISSQDLPQSEASGLFWFNSILSISLALTLVFMAPVFGRLYEQPAVTGVILLLTAHVVASGAANVHLALMSRSMQFKKLAIIDVAKTIGGFVVAMITALYSPTAVALAAQMIGAGVIGLIAAWSLASWKPSGKVSIAQLKPTLRFGAGMTMSSLSNYVSRNADNLMIGWACGPLQLGLYDRAYKLLLLPLQQINSPVSMVMVPVLSRLSPEAKRYRQAYLKSLRQMLLVTAPGMAILICTAPVLVPSLLGPLWQDSVPIFQWLGLAGLHQTVSNTFGWLFVSQRRTDEYAKYSIFGAATCLGSFALGLQWDALGVAIAYALSGIFVRLPVIVWLVGRSGPVSAKDIAMIFAPYALAVLAGVTAWFTLTRFFMLSPWVYLLASALVIYLFAWMFLSLTTQGRDTIRETVALICQRT